MDVKQSLISGKTNVAMLCVLQTIRQHMENDVIKKDTFKIVYVAPMKALAAEMTATFGKRYVTDFSLIS